MKFLFGSSKTEKHEWGELTIFEKKLVFQSFNTGLLTALLLMLVVWIICGVGDII